jgi:hypothetical protein
MPIHIDNLTSRVHVSTGDLPFTPEQLDRLVEHVRTRLAEQHHLGALNRQATELRRDAAPASPIVE